MKFWKRKTKDAGESQQFAAGAQGENNARLFEELQQLNVELDNASQLPTGQKGKAAKASQKKASEIVKKLKASEKFLGKNRKEFDSEVKSALSKMDAVLSNVQKYISSSDKIMKRVEKILSAEGKEKEKIAAQKEKEKEKKEKAREKVKLQKAKEQQKKLIKKMSPEEKKRYNQAKKINAENNALWEAEIKAAKAGGSGKKRGRPASMFSAANMKKNKAANEAMIKLFEEELKPIRAAKKKENEYHQGVAQWHKASGRDAAFKKAWAEKERAAFASMM